MKLVLTLLCRNEAHIIRQVLDYHFARGVDQIIVMDNGSVDGTQDILAAYRRKHPLLILHERSHTHDQSVWVSQMAEIAVQEFGADWLIHSDADEFWWPRRENLKRALGQIPEAVQAVSVDRRNFLPPIGEGALPQQCFATRQTIRERTSRNSLGAPLPPKVCHRSGRNIVVSDGNHAVEIGGRLVSAKPIETIEVLHFPVRSFGQLERKIRDGCEALFANRRISPQIGSTWRKIYFDYYLPGRLKDYYEGLIPSPEILEQKLVKGELVRDTRLRDYLDALAQ